MSSYINKVKDTRIGLAYMQALLFKQKSGSVLYFFPTYRMYKDIWSLREGRKSFKAVSVVELEAMVFGVILTHKRMNTALELPMNVGLFA